MDGNLSPEFPPDSAKVAFPPPFLLPALGGLLLILVGLVGYRFWRHKTISVLGEACAAAIDSQDWERAEEIGLRWAALDSTNARVLVYLADAAKGQRAFDRMTEYLLRVPDSDPDAPLLLALAAEVQFNELVHPFEAEQTWRRLLAVRPDSNVARKRLQYFYALTLQRDKLQEQIREALATQSESPDTFVYQVLLYALSFTNAYPQLTVWLQSDPQNETLRVARAWALVKAPTNVDARSYSGTGVRPGDRALLDECLRDFPENPELFAFQLDEAVDQGDVSALARLLSRAPAAADRDPRYWRGRGWYLRSQNSLEGAATAYSKAIQLFPFDWRARHELSLVLRRQGEVSSAAEQAELSLAGKELERRILELPNTSEVPTTILQEIGAYARRVGDQELATALDYRVGREIRPSTATVP